MAAGFQEVLSDDQEQPINESSDPQAIEPIAQYCRNFWTEFHQTQYRTKKDDERSEARERYKMVEKKKEFPFKNASNRTLGLEAIAVDTLVPRLVRQIFSENEDFIQVEPETQQDVQNAEDVKEHMHWCVRDNMKFKEAVRPIVEDLAIEGTVDVITQWWEREVRTPIRQLRQVVVNPQGQPIPASMLPPQMMQMPDAILQSQGFKRQVDSTITYRDGKEFRVKMHQIRMSDAVFPDSYDSWDEMPYMYRIFPTYEELKRNSVENGGPYKNVTPALIRLTDRDGTDMRDQAIDSDDVQYGDNDIRREVELYEFFVRWNGKWYIVDTTPDFATIVREQLVEEVYGFDRKPVHRLRIFADSHTSMGTGIAHKARQYSMGVDGCFNAMLDSAAVEIAPWWLFIPGAGGATQHVQNLKFIPGRGNALPGGGQVVFPQLGLKSPAFLKFIEMLMSFFERMMSLMDHTLSGNATGRGAGTETATGMNLLVNEGNIKHSYMASGLRHQFNKVLTDIHCLYALYVPPESMRMIYEDGQWQEKEFDIAAIQGRYNFRIQVSDASANDELNRQRKQFILEILSQHGDIVDRPRLITDFLKAMGYEDNTEYIRPEVNMLLQALAQNPNLMEVVKQAMIQFEQEQKTAQIAGEAEDNLHRQMIQRTVEQQHPAIEDSRLVDQVRESQKRQAIAAAMAPQPQPTLSNLEGGT